MKRNLCLCFAVILMGCNSTQTKSNSSPRFNHVYLNTIDIDRSIAFYKEAFDVEVFNEIKKITRTDASGNKVTSDTHIVLLCFPGQSFNLEIGAQSNFSPQNGQASYTHLGIDVIDIESASKRLIAAGAVPLRPIGMVEANDISAKTAFFTGPNGETLELMQIIEGEF